MYTKNDILLESAFYGDMTKINVATDMMCETYIDQMFEAEDEDTFNEAGKGVVGTIVKMIGGAISRIIKFLKDRVTGIKKSASMKRIINAMDPETKAAVLRVKSKEKVKFPDVAKASKLLDQAEKGMNIMVDKVSSSIAAMDNMKPSKKAKECEKLDKYVESSVSKISSIYEQVNDVLSKPIDVPVGTAFKYMEEGVDLTKRCEAMEKQLSKYGADLSKSIQKIDLSADAIKESAELYMDDVEYDDAEYQESVDDDELYEEKKSAADPIDTAVAEVQTATKTKGVVGRTLTGISTFVHNHAKAIAAIIGATAAIAGTVVIAKNADNIKGAATTAKRTTMKKVHEAQAKHSDNKAIRKAKREEKNSRKYKVGNETFDGSDLDGILTRKNIVSKDAGSYKAKATGKLW